MESSTFGIMRRFGFVIGILVAWHALSRLIAMWATNHDIFEQVKIDREVEYTSYYGNVVYTETVTEYPGSEYLSVYTDGWSWAVAHIAGAIGLLLIAGGIAIVLSVYDWIVEGPSDYVDPCNNPKCPCARHEVERQEAEAARQAALLATTVATSAAISASISST